MKEKPDFCSFHVKPKGWETPPGTMKALSEMFACCMQFTI